MGRTPRFALLALCLAGCSHGTATPDSGADFDASATADAGPLADGRPVPENSAVYAHSADELFRIDPDTLTQTSVGMFTFDVPAENITDIAIDKSGNMIGISLTSVFSIDKDTAAATHLASFATGQGGLTSLSFVPVDLNDPSSSERLVAADFDGVVWEINATNGQRTMIGNYNATGNAIGSSGDIVSISGLGTFATVNVQGSSTDHLARLDPVTWQAIVLGDTGRDKIFGLGFWGGDLYGFTDGMELVTLDSNNGSVTASKSSPVSWWGAGVTTLAPIVN